MIVVFFILLRMLFLINIAKYFSNTVVATTSVFYIDYIFIVISNDRSDKNILIFSCFIARNIINHVLE